MPGFGSFAALEIVREQWLDIPFIVVSRTPGEDLAVNVMKGMSSHCSRTISSAANKPNPPATEIMAERSQAAVSER